MEAGSNRTAKASSIEKPRITASTQIRNAALTLRGKFAKFFKIKLGDTVLNAAMWDYVDVTLRFEGIVMPLFLCIFEIYFPSLWRTFCVFLSV